MLGKYIIPTLRIFILGYNQVNSHNVSELFERTSKALLKELFCFTIDTSFKWVLTEKYYYLSQEFLFIEFDLLKNEVFEPSIYIFISK